MAGHVPVPHASSQPLAADPYFTTEARERGRPARWRSGISRAWHLAQCVLRVPMDRSAPGDALAAGAVRWGPFDLRPAAWRLAIGLASGAGGTGLRASLGTMELEKPRALGVCGAVCTAIFAFRDATAWLCGLSPLRRRMHRYRGPLSWALLSYTLSVTRPRPPVGSGR